MPPEALASAPPGRFALPLPVAWRRPLLLLAAAWAVSICLFRADWRDMAGQWWKISTYNHVLLMPPIVGWLIALRRRDLAGLTPEAWWPGLLAVGAAALMWVLGSFAGLSLARQLGAVGMLQGTVLAVLGPRVSVGLAFPLAYMLFLVPFGDELIPVLQLITARIATGLLGLSRIPASLEGVFIATPVALFKVAEACSGLKFLIAMAAFAVLAANLCFRTWPRRIGFVGGALVLAVVANGVRAWGTIVLAHSRGVAFASGFDHLFYGWIFFALVIALTLALGWRWFDRAPDDPQIDADRLLASPLLTRLARRRIGDGAALGIAIALALGATAWAQAADRLAAPLPVQVGLPQVQGWQRIDYAPRVWWQPRHAGAAHRLLGRFADADGDTVDVAYALYASQGEGQEAGGFGEGALTPGGAWAWVEPGPALSGTRTERIVAGSVERACATWYRTGDTVTGSNSRLKLANIADRLLLRRRATAVLILSAEERPGHPATRALSRFVAATGGPAAWMDRVATTR
ncbi:exosortase A [Novosphingobium sp. Gsoil 351]|uniref:exosortase A n=1 Tax=Novosphingobium sp. Gsoil 351 TaxID=2675225 RepID=UPI0012B463F8|nr:exosortase A [Novosphingobium sp. Gsoil 351]QGN53211.1 exosortase A [Novosphingobium sp. Gsoil 351]